MHLLSSICIIALNIGYISGGATIGNGYVIIGVNDEGHLNTPYVGNVLGLPSTDPININHMGLRNGDDGIHVAGSFASTEPGCLCEGWGVAVPNLGLAMYANIAVDRGVNNMHLVSFDGVDGDDSAISVVRDTSNNIRVTHSFFPALESDYAMRVDVTIRNIGTETFNNTLYRRVMDWDIYPTPFSEYVTVIGTDANKLVFSNDNGFCSANPMAACRRRSPGTVNRDFKDIGPTDHGACFDFDLGPLPPNEFARFKIFYGVAPGERSAMRSLWDIGAEVASLGQQSGSPEAGLPYTFFFGFGEVGGKTIGEPATTATPDCGCYTTTLIGQRAIGPTGLSGSCYRYEVFFCDNEVDTVVLGRGKAEEKCGQDMNITDITLSTQPDRMRSRIVYNLVYDDMGENGPKVRGIQVSGLENGDRFRICFNATKVYGLMAGGNVEYQNSGGLELMCPVSATLPDFCPHVGPSAAAKSVAYEVRNDAFDNDQHLQWDYIEEARDAARNGGEDVVEVPVATLMTMTFITSASLSVLMIVLFVGCIWYFKYGGFGMGMRGNYGFSKVDLVDVDVEEQDVVID